MKVTVRGVTMVPKFPPDLMHNNFISEFVSWNIATVEKSPGDWKSLEDIHTVISFGLTGQLATYNARFSTTHYIAFQ
ncbi:9518_t:CDS:2 [Rhizophagus irregularis]|uniref:Uncharacterized protein n=1 Tax=Rhizophagus irregularis (strain DAOM 181602 / DAOM 197198 / MUCL 43194) TaxID=747089 RepID=U9TDJ5_RHIID|nr:9518_t:CDS:2 [Rhizophagus irregularis]